MDLLVQLAELKAKSITYVFNNKKIRKIISIQRRKEVINSTIQKIREKLIRWRKFTRTTMGTEPSLSAKDDYQRISEDTKKHLVAWAERHIHKKTEGNLSDSDYDDEFSKLNLKKTESKTVQFDLENENDEALIAKNLTQVKISTEESMLLQKKLAKEFVAEKLKKMRKSVRFYLWLNKTFTEQIMFKNNKEQLKQIVKLHAAGDV